MGKLTVREARRQRGLTQSQLAAASGINQTTISDIETGRHTNPRLDTVTRLAQALGIAPSELRFEAPEPSATVEVGSDTGGHSDRTATAAKQTASADRHATAAERRAAERRQQPHGRRATNGLRTDRRKAAGRRASDQGRRR